MGREVRKVPSNWQHPKDERGQFIPLLDGSFKEKAAKWDAEAEQWVNGFYCHFDGAWEAKSPDMTGTYEEWNGSRPEEHEYMPDWTEAERTHFQMYESTTEGTPISPVMETPEALALWLSTTGASAFGGQGATYDEWLTTIKCSSAPSAIFIPGQGLVSGVAGIHAMGQ